MKAGDAFLYLATSIYLSEQAVSAGHVYGVAFVWIFSWLLNILHFRMEKKSGGIFK